MVYLLGQRLGRTSCGVDGHNITIHFLCQDKMKKNMDYFELTQYNGQTLCLVQPNTSLTFLGSKLKT